MRLKRRAVAGLRSGFRSKTGFGFEDEDTSLINNRQAGRRRGRGSNNGGGSGGGGNPRQGGGQGRDNGNRIDSRARGNAAQLHEKYKNLARDAQQSGDRVNIEYYLQFADHYFRVLSEQRSRFEDSQPRRQQSNDAFDDGYDADGDDDFGAEGEPIRAGEQTGEQRYDTNRNDGQRGDGNRNDGNRSDSQRNDQGRGDQNRGDGQRREYQGQRQDGGRQDNGRQDGQRYEGNRQDGQRYERQDGQRADQPRGNDRRPREDQTGEQTQPRAERPQRIDRQRVQPREEVGAPVETVVADAPSSDEAPRRRGRPRRDAAPIVPGEEAPAVIEADRLPPSLSAAPLASNDVGEDAPKPRRRRTPRTDSPEVTAAE